MPTYSNPYQYPQYPQYPPQYPQQSTLLQTQQQQPQIQNGGFISVQNEAEARAWAVAAGTSVTFKDENAPYCYTKTMGFSQLDQPRFEKYRLVKEEPAVIAPEGAGVQIDDSAIKDLRGDIDALTERVARLEKKPVKKKIVVEDEEDDV